jgi:hypothetical protein
MPAVWHKGSDGWRALAPVGYPAEKILHDLVEETPDLLPISAPERLTIVGREVQLGNGFADLVAVEPSGRVVIIEIKLQSNADAKRAVVAQILSYAAYLHRRTPQSFEEADLSSHLERRGHAGLASAVEAGDQEGSFDVAAFDDGLAESLETGRFRLIIVLDDAPPDLVRLVGYLESVAEHLLIDLVTVSSFDANGEHLVVPQRIDPGSPAAVTAPPRPTTKTQGYVTEGSAAFAEVAASAPAGRREQLERLAAWADGLAAEGLVRLETYHGQRGLVLLPRLKDEGVGLATGWATGGGSITLWRRVFERRAPRSLPVVERLVEPAKVGQGTAVPEITEELLQALTDAYREAVGQWSPELPIPDPEV